MCRYVYHEAGAIVIMCTVGLLKPPNLVFSAKWVEEIKFSFGKMFGLVILV